MPIHNIDDRYQFQGADVRVFVYEHITGGGLAGQAIPASLAHEGDIMLRALVTDLVDAGVEVVTTRDERLPAIDLPADVASICDLQQKDEVLQLCMMESDAVWPIAPEACGVLERISEQIQSNGGVLLNSRPPAVRIASSKLNTTSRLAEHGVPVVPTFDANQYISARYSRWVFKPDDGAGCVETHIVYSSEELPSTLAELDQAVQYVAQPYVVGPAVSLSMLCSNGQALLLACNRQQVAVINEAFCLLGCVVNDPSAWGEYAAPLAADIAAAMPGLWGYVGVDLLLTDDGPLVLEVNPRLTLSYVGLTNSLGMNAAELVLGLLDDKQWPVAEVAAGRMPVTVNLEVHYVP
jgi:tyramine---L-glutamate ligase